MRVTRAITDAHAPIASHAPQHSRQRAQTVSTASRPTHTLAASRKARDRRMDASAAPPIARALRTSDIRAGESSILWGWGDDGAATLRQLTAASGMSPQAPPRCWSCRSRTCGATRWEANLGGLVGPFGGGGLVGAVLFVLLFVAVVAMFVLFVAVVAMFVLLCLWRLWPCAFRFVCGGCGRVCSVLAVVATCVLCVCGGCGHVPFCAESLLQHVCVAVVTFVLFRGDCGHVCAPRRTARRRSTSTGQTMSLASAEPPPARSADATTPKGPGSTVRGVCGHVRCRVAIVAK